MLEGFLYTLVSKEEGCAVVRMLPESPIYAAHFPGFPVTPGVTLVQIALELMGRKLQSARDIKFVVPVIPSADGPELKYEWSYADESRADVNVFFPDGTLCAKMALGV